MDITLTPEQEAAAAALLADLEVCMSWAITVRPAVAFVQRAVQMAADQ